MREEIFKDKFSMEDYIQKRLLEVENPQNRDILREILGKVFLPMCEYMEESYHGLEQRMKEENSAEKQVAIKSAVISREKYDMAEEVFRPIILEDCCPLKIDLIKLAEAMAMGKEYFLFKIFLKLDYLELERLEGSKRKFHGTVKTVNGEYNAVFQLKKSTDYIQRAAQMYHTFLQNKIQWKTLCIPYLHKFFDVYMMAGDEFLKEEVTEVSIDFQEYKEAVCYDYIPLWNVATVYAKTDSFPSLCIDQIHYEHKIYENQLEKYCEYLVAEEEEDFTGIRKKQGGLCITCNAEEGRKWKLYKIGKESSIRLEEPVMDNTRREMADIPIRTRGGICKFIQSLGVDERLILKNIIFTRDKPQILETYSMDGFIEDEIILRNKENCMILEFEPKEKEWYLNRDVMSYAVSALAREYREFSCFGRLV